MLPLVVEININLCSQPEIRLQALLQAVQVNVEFINCTESENQMPFFVSTCKVVHIHINTYLHNISDHEIPSQDSPVGG